MEMPPLPNYPTIPASEDRGKWNAWARAYGESCARMAREEAAQLCEEIGRVLTGGTSATANEMAAAIRRLR